MTKKLKITLFTSGGLLAITGSILPLAIHYTTDQNAILVNDALMTDQALAVEDEVALATIDEEVSKIENETSLIESDEVALATIDEEISKIEDETSLIESDGVNDVDVLIDDQDSIIGEENSAINPSDNLKYFFPHTLDIFLDDDVRRVQNYKMPYIPERNRLKLTYDELKIKVGNTYAGWNIQAYFRENGLDIERDYGFPPKPWYSAEDWHSYGPHDQRVLRSWKLESINKYTGDLTFTLWTQMNTGNPPKPWFPPSQTIKRLIGTKTFQVMPSQRYINEQIEKQRVADDMARIVNKAVDNGPLEISQKLPLPKIGEVVGRSSRLDENGDGEYNFADDYRFSGPIHQWPFVIDPETSSGSTITPLDTIIGAASWMVSREYSVYDVNEKTGSVTILVKVSYGRYEKHLERRIFGVNGFLTKERAKDQVEYDIDKFKPYQETPLQLAEKVPLPEVGTIIGETSKLDENGDGLYSYHEDYRLSGDINRWKFKNGWYISSLDQTIGPATWMTNRSYQVTLVDYIRQEISVTVTISNPWTGYSEKIIFKIAGFYSYQNQMEYDAAKFAKQPDLYLDQPVQLPQVATILGRSSKLDENNDGEYHYHDDYQRTGEINRWKFTNNKDKAISLDEMVGPATWLVSREYKVVKTIRDHSKGDNYAIIEVTITSGPYTKKVRFNIHGFA